MALHYKIVSIRDERYYSLFNTTSSIVEYKIGESVKPQFGKIFTFNDLERCVQYFKHQCSGKKIDIFAIFECEVENPAPLNDICFYSSRFQEFWEYKPKDLINMRYLTMSAPPDTIGVDSCKLIKEIDYTASGL